MHVVKDLAPLCRTRSTLARAALARIWLYLGGYRACRQVAWHRVQRLVFVCKGNICRSPYAEFRARALGLNAVSFGLDARDGRPPHPLALETALGRDVDLSAARARVQNGLAIDSGDLLLAMEPWQLRGVARLCRRSGAQCSLLGLWGGLAMPWLPDPYSDSAPTFQHCYAVIDRALDDLAARLQPVQPAPAGVVH
ncbi:MAG: hypothetical protein JJT90_11285 [Ectothiorhodospiraceae bacterium]|nr:hypothetical protein [Ectothiorhodospiraceae bacterium]